MFRSNLKPYINNYSMLYGAGGENSIDIGSVSDFSFIQNTGIFTISLWFKMTDYTDGSRRFFMGNSNTSGVKGFFLEYDGAGTDQIEINLSTGVGWVIKSVSTSNIVGDNNWHHLAVKGDGTNIFFYMDNVKETGSGTMSTLSSGDSTNTLTLANLLGSGSSTFYGNLDEVSIFDIAISDAEITNIYNSGKPNNLKEHTNFTNCQLWTRFDNSVYSTVTTEYIVDDGSGNGRTGITQNMEESDRLFDTP